jgi:hypothetical protein
LIDEGDVCRNNGIVFEPTTENCWLVTPLKNFMHFVMYHETINRMNADAVYFNYRHVREIERQAVNELAPLREQLVLSRWDWLNLRLNTPRHDNRPPWTLLPYVEHLSPDLQDLIHRLFGAVIPRQ